MKVALFRGPEGGERRLAALKAALEAASHEVAAMDLSVANLARAERGRFALLHRLRRRLTGAPMLPHPWDLAAQELTPRLRAARSGVCIAHGTAAAHVALCGGVDRVVVDVDRIETLVLANRWHVDAVDLAATHQREAQVLARALRVTISHAAVGELLLEAFPRVAGLASRLVIVPDGLHPQAGPPLSRDGAIVVAGTADHAEDPLLQAALVARLGVRARRLGAAGPARQFLPEPPPLLQPGEAVSFGLVTRLADRLSRLRADRVNEMLERGMPVLAPRWLAVDPALEPAVARYEESAFETDVEAALGAFGARVAAAAAVRTSRSWPSTLAPLLEGIAEW